MILTSIERENLRYLSDEYRKDLNKIKLSKANTLTHEMAKCKLAYFILKNNRKFVIEGRFKDNQGRADIIDLTESICYEIMQTEKIEKIELKKGKYPLPIVYLNAQDVLDCPPESIYKIIN